MDSSEGFGEIVNLGSNFEVSIGDTVQAIAEVLGRDVEIISEEARLRPEKSEVDRLWADNRKAQKLFGWQPEYGGLDGFKRGLLETANWFAEAENLSRYKGSIYNI